MPAIHGHHYISTNIFYAALSQLPFQELVSRFLKDATFLQAVDEESLNY